MSQELDEWQKQRDREKALTEAMNLLATKGQELPEGWEITITIRSDEISADLTSPCGEYDYVHYDGDLMTDAVRFAQEHSED